MQIIYPVSSLHPWGEKSGVVVKKRMMNYVSFVTRMAAIAIVGGVSSCKLAIGV
jgi:hypothetical protein